MHFLVTETGYGTFKIMRTIKRVLEPTENHEPGQDLYALIELRKTADTTRGEQRAAQLK